MTQTVQHLITPWMLLCTGKSQEVCQKEKGKRPSLSPLVESTPLSHQLQPVGTVHPGHAACSIQCSILLKPTFLMRALTPAPPYTAVHTLTFGSQSPTPRPNRSLILAN